MSSHRPLLLLLLLVSVVLLFIQQRPETEPEVQEALFRDNYFLLNFETLAFNKEGKPDTLIIGQRLNQPVNSQEHHVQAPRIRQLKGLDVHWEVSARQATLDEHHSQATLDDNVLISRFDGETGEAALKVSTPTLLLDIPAQSARTDEQVIITDGPNRLTGKGMSANLDAARLELHADTEALYVFE